MLRKQNLHWYTLAEILVVITIIWILALAISSFNFSRLNAKQLVSIETIKIENILSEVRDNALVWKWVWIDLEVPTSWEIDISNDTSSWSIRTNYFIPSSASALTYKNGSWDAPNSTAIIDIRCRVYEWNSTSRNNATIEFILSLIHIWRCRRRG